MITFRKLLSHFDDPTIKVSVNTLTSVAGNLKTIADIRLDPNFQIDEGTRRVYDWKFRSDGVLEVTLY